MLDSHARIENIVGTRILTSVHIVQHLRNSKLSLRTMHQIVRIMLKVY